MNLETQVKPIKLLLGDDYIGSWGKQLTKSIEATIKMPKLVAT